MTEKDTHYLSDEEAAELGFFPDEEHTKVGDDMPGMAFNVEGNPFRSKSGTINVGEHEVVELPPHVRQKVETIERVYGILRGRPATSSNRGGGLITIKTKPAHIRTRKKATIKKWGLT